MSLQPVWIPDNAPTECFPDVEYALEEPNGLLAVGGDLGVERLLYAYKKGIFPWYSEGQPILWWSPDPRAVLLPNQIKISRSLRKTIRRGHFEIRINSAFASVMRACAEPRPGQEGTWIIDEMVEAYERLHGLGWAHSIETWTDDRLAGGLYGVAVGTVFFGESMFTRVTDASKVALVALAELGFELIDCQLPNDHLLSLGAQLLTRGEFTRSLEKMCDRELPSPMGAAGVSDAPTGALGTAIRFRLSRAAQDIVTPKSIRNDSNPIGTPSETLAGSGEDLPGENRR